MSTLPERILRLEQELGSAVAGTLMLRVGHLEVCCFGSEAAGPLLQRLSKLEALAGCPEEGPKGPEAEPVQDRDAEDVGAEVDADDAAASNQVAEPEVFALPAAKRQRCGELRKEGGYQLEANAGAMAQNPKAFKEHPLREEQRRSLAWMYAQEAREHRLKGGLLADKMGYGKTATTIGMLSEKVPQIPGQRPEGYISNQATLILCPPHLVEQWEDEFFKFMGDQVQLVRPEKGKGKPSAVLPKVKLMNSEPLSVHGLVVSELSREMQRHNAKLAPEKQLKVGDEIRSLKIETPNGETLVLNQHQAWGSKKRRILMGANRFQSFLDDNCERGCTLHITVAREKAPHTKPFRGDGPFRILTLANHTDFACLKLGDLLGFHVVLVSTSILGTQQHMDWIKDTLTNWLAETGGREVAKGKGMKFRQKKFRECVEKWHEKDSFLKAALSSTPAFLEAMWWNRMVLDEFHESQSWTSRVRDVVKLLGATHRWGLTGTPPLDTTPEVLEVGEMLDYISEATPFMKEGIRNLNIGRTLVEPENKQQLEDECQAMIRDVVRQNSSQLVEAIRVVEHEEFVQFSAEEQLIYRQACHDHDMFDAELAYARASLRTREALLKRCAHFCLDMEAANAGEAVRFLGRQKRDRIQHVQQQLQIDAARAAHLDVWEACKHGLLAHKAQHAQTQTFIQKLYETSPEELKEYFDQNGFRRLRPEVRFKQPLRCAQVYNHLSLRHAIQHVVARQCAPECDRFLSQMQVCTQIGCTDPAHIPLGMGAGFEVLARSLDTAHRSLDFYEGQRRVLSDAETLKGQQCPVCLTPNDDLSALVMLPCAHIFHRDCVREALATNPKCPYCRAHAPPKSMSSVLLEVEVGSAPAETLPPELRSHGSKLLAVARRLQKIRAEDPKAKAIVFVQWLELEDQIASALRDHGLPALQLPRGRNESREMAGVIKTFTASEEAFVLLLSLEHAASGTNLTAANHVIFVHPMNAETLNSAVAYERQALARVRRVGQERSEVHVWRFVTRETVEEYMHELHSQRVPLPDEARAAGA